MDMHADFVFFSFLFLLAQDFVPPQILHEHRYLHHLSIRVFC